MAAEKKVGTRYTMSPGNKAILSNKMIILHTSSRNTTSCLLADAELKIYNKNLQRMEIIKNLNMPGKKCPTKMQAHAQRARLDLGHDPSYSSTCA